ncbi:hypothetical protein GCK72_013184 [Caenorhabditis remanei]|uniref:Serpentine receptor class r-10 n=1 Tax=Caenorhabditis remanei TaxID=31234 RepID=A0A6A5GN78_CAERE|nr:hypothetical protein GCK72_013184 [Caenorhabditis remanei]KAF1756730.1 hypothetical protein GCK72_013184 [Caenorhabditis remanei]
MGTYRHLMIYFCCVSIVFSILDIIVQPNVQTYKSAFFMVVEVQRRNMDPWIAKVSVYCLCGCFGVAHYCIAIHFIYRFFALERKGRVRYFQGFNLIIWFLIPIFSGAMWFLITAEVFTQTSIEIDYIRNIVKQTFSADMHEIVFVSGIFYPIDQTVLMTIPFTVIIVFGFRSWKIVRGLLDHGESEYSKNLQMQLYKALVAQNFQTYKSAYILVVEVKRRNMDPWIAKGSIYCICGCFGVVIYCIAIHFIYRLFALERKGRVRYFQGNNLIIWFLIPIVCGAAWLLITSEVYTQTKIEADYIRNSVKQTFNSDMEDIVFISGIFYPIDKTGLRIFNWRTFLGFGLFSILMTIPFTVIIVFGFRSWKIVRGLLDHGESEYSKNLQMQLYKALVAQTVLPMIFLFIPFGLLFSLPMFEIDCQLLSSFITLTFAMYPAVDPLPILYFIDYYRNPIIGLELLRKTDYTMCETLTDAFKLKCCKRSRISNDESITIG